VPQSTSGRSVVMRPACAGSPWTCPGRVGAGQAGAGREPGAIDRFRPRSAARTTPEPRHQQTAPRTRCELVAACADGEHFALQHAATPRGTPYSETRTPPVELRQDPQVAHAFGPDRQQHDFRRRHDRRASRWLTRTGSAAGSRRRGDRRRRAATASTTAGTRARRTIATRLPQPMETSVDEIGPVGWGQRVVEEELGHVRVPFSLGDGVSDAPETSRGFRRGPSCFIGDTPSGSARHPLVLGEEVVLVDVGSDATSQVASRLLIEAEMNATVNARIVDISVICSKLV
jgi:hypothetical protein